MRLGLNRARRKPTIEIGPGAFRVRAGALIAVAHESLWVRASMAAPWQRLVSGPGFSCVTASADGQVLYVGLTYGNIWRSVDGGLQWLAADHGLRLPWPGYTSMEDVVVHPQNPSLVYAVHRDGLYRSGDGGVSWLLLTHDLPFVPSCMAVDWRQPENLWLGGLRYHLSQSVDGGRTWRQIAPGALPLRRAVWNIVISPRSNGHVYVAADDLYQTMDGGTTWARLEGGWPRDVPRSIAVSPADPRRLYLMISELRQIYVSQDSGRTWAVSRGASAGIGVREIVGDPEAALIAYAATVHGVMRTLDGGLTWSDWNDAELTAQTDIQRLLKVPAPMQNTPL